MRDTHIVTQDINRVHLAGNLEAIDVEPAAFINPRAATPEAWLDLLRSIEHVTGVTVEHLLPNGKPFVGIAPDELLFDRVKPAPGVLIALVLDEPVGAPDRMRYGVIVRGKVGPPILPELLG